MAGAVAEGSDAAAGTSPSLPPSTDWTLRPFEDSSHPLPRIALTFAGIFVVSALAFRISIGDLTLRFWEQPVPLARSPQRRALRLRAHRDSTVYGVHQSVVAAKRETLEALRGRIRAAGANLLDGRSPDASPTLADLIALHGFIERVREWPISAPTVARGALITALALGSWLGGALVERLLESVAAR